MAKFVFSPLVQDARGKFGNAVFSANGSGKYIRGLVRPTNPNTTGQSRVRSRFGAIAQAWRALAEGQREGWNQAVVDYIQQDVFGVDVQLSGFQLFAKLNNSLVQVGAPTIDDAVPPVIFQAQVLTVAALTTGIRMLALDNLNEGQVAAVPAGTVAVVSMTRIMSAGKMTAKDNEFRQIAVLPAGTVLPYETLLAAYQAVFGEQPLIADLKFFAKTQIVALANGQRSAPVYDMITILQDV